MSDSRLTPEALEALHRRMLLNRPMLSDMDFMSPREYDRRHTRLKKEGVPIWVPSFCPWPLPPVTGGAPASIKDETDGEEKDAEANEG